MTAQRFEASHRGKIRAIISDIETRIEAGQLQPGERLPTQRALARERGVAVRTVSVAYAALIKKGLLISNTKNGTRVALPRDALAENASPPLEVAAPFTDLRLNSPPLRTKLPLFRRYLQELSSQKNLEQLFDYPKTFHPRFHATDSLMNRLEQAKIPLRGRTPLFTAGAHHALFITLLFLSRTTTTIAVEEMTYRGIQHIAASLSITLVPIRISPAGLDLDDFRRKHAKHAFQAAIITPWGNNPTTWRTPVEVQAELVAFCRDNDVVIVEDDAGLSFYFGEPSTVMRSDVDNNFYIGSFSKAIAPGLRVGFLIAPTQYQAQIQDLISASLWVGPSVGMGLVGKFLADDDIYERLRSEHISESQRRIEIVRRYLGFMDPHCCSGLYYCWIPLRSRALTSEVLFRLQAVNLAVTSASRYQIGPATHSGIRIAFGRPPTRADLHRGGKLLREVLQSGHADGG